MWSYRSGSNGSPTCNSQLDGQSRWTAWARQLLETSAGRCSYESSYQDQQHQCRLRAVLGCHLLCAAATRRCVLRRDPQRARVIGVLHLQATAPHTYDQPAATQLLRGASGRVPEACTHGTHAACAPCQSAAAAPSARTACTSSPSACLAATLCQPAQAHPRFECMRCCAAVTQD